MRYDISTSDWESQQFWTLNGPDLSTKEWDTLWKKTVAKAAEICYNEYGGYVCKDMVVEKAVEVLISNRGFSHSSGDRSKNFNFAGVDLEDIKDLGEHIPKEYLEKSFTKRKRS